MNKQNQDLQKLYSDKSCEVCGRKYPVVEINIEGYIHHHDGFKCLDKKSCQRFKRKSKS